MRQSEFSVVKTDGTITYNALWDLIQDLKNEKVHPLDLKMSIAEWLGHLFEPLRKRFEDKELAATFRRAFL